MGKDFWFRIGIMGLGLVPVVLVVAFFFLK